MADCECLPGCPFFNDKMANMPAMASTYKSKYCQGDFANCARYMVFKALGKPSVPMDLYPNQKDTASRIIKGG
ncbi:MAG: hypothetical protein JXQ65_16445 [Candidatus Marinimicrobia bacterium]|nr:hypothetical protein [Candidatus Neomarinimicrobiota bacterium]